MNKTFDEMTKEERLEYMKEANRQLWAPQIKAMRQIQKECDHDKEDLHIELDRFILRLLPEVIKDEYDNIEEEEGGFWYS